MKLLGDNADLAWLSKQLRGEDITICLTEADGYMLRSNTFERCRDASEVRTNAEQIVTALCAYSRLYWRGTRSIEVGSVIRHRENGTRDIFLKAECAALQCRGFPAELTVTRSDGTVERGSSSDRLQEWIEYALRDPDVAKALRLRNTDRLSWVELYRLYEVVEGAVGRSAIVASGWISESKIRLFKHTANSVEAIGDEARHGRRKHQPPKDPMKLSEARRLVDELIKNWLC